MSNISAASVFCHFKNFYLHGKSCDEITLSINVCCTRTTASANGMRLTSESLAKTAICRSMSHKHASFERTSVDLDHSNMEVS